jgi:hypothetical protein
MRTNTIIHRPFITLLDDESGGKRNTHIGNEKYIQNFGRETSKEEINTGEQGVNWKIILKRIVGQWGLQV